RSPDVRRDQQQHAQQQDGSWTESRHDRWAPPARGDVTAISALARASTPNFPAAACQGERLFRRGRIEAEGTRLERPDAIAQLGGPLELELPRCLAHLL